MKLVCAFLSLPVPSRYSTSCGFLSCNVVARTAPDYVEHGIVHKFLLVGYSGSGTSTIFKQVIFYLVIIGFAIFVCLLFYASWNFLLVWKNCIRQYMFEGLPLSKL
jgi:hypothetical protein